MERVRAEAHTLRMDFRFHAGYSLFENMFFVFLYTFFDIQGELLRNQILQYQSNNMLN